MPFNVTYNNNNTSNDNNNNNNNNGNDMNNHKNNKDIDEYCKEREKIGQRRQVAAAIVLDDKKLRIMRRSYRYVAPAPSQYPHASIAADDRYAQLGQVLRGNIMIGSTFRENTSTEFRRSYSKVWGCPQLGRLIRFTGNNMCTLQGDSISCRRLDPVACASYVDNETRERNIEIGKHGE